MPNPIGSSKWILCTGGIGYVRSHGERDRFPSHFQKDSVAIVLDELHTEFLVFLPGEKKEYFVGRSDTREIDIYSTGKGHKNKICNICFVLKPIDNFEKNQVDTKSTRVRRPSCKICRQDIDRRRIPKRQKDQAEQHRPGKGTLWECPICRKMGIAGVNVKVVADHNHYSGTWRGFLCESCNTGLGRFKNGENYLLNAIAYLKEHDT